MEISCNTNAFNFRSDLRPSTILKGEASASTSSQSLRATATDHTTAVNALENMGTVGKSAAGWQQHGSKIRQVTEFRQSLSPDELVQGSTYR